MKTGAVSAGIDLGQKANEQTGGPRLSRVNLFVTPILFKIKDLREICAKMDNVLFCLPLSEHRLSSPRVDKK